MTDHVDLFEEERARLRGLAYRMLGVVADADDVVQETWLRWDRAPRETIRNPQGWLTTVATRLAIDQLRSRKRRQPSYVGPWLPEPIVTTPNDPEAVVELSESLTFAFLTMLEVLSPAERAAFLLVEVFGEPSAAAAAVLDRSEAACRQLVSRARAKLRDEPTVGGAGPSAAGSRSPTPAATRFVIDRFVTALAAGDEAAALACLDDDVELVSDGGPARRAARHPVVGAARVARFLAGLAKRVDDGWSADPATVGGQHGLVIRDADHVELVVWFEVDDTTIRSVRLLMNPEKLRGATHPGAII